MGLNCGIVGLPNAGKSTIFSALTSASVKAESYPFCTIEPNVGVVKVPDERLQKLEEIFEPEEVIHATIEFVDIAGLVEGASEGEGLGNRFLSHIREVDAIIHVVRCFENPNVSHPYEEINPVRDIGVVEMELELADLETVKKRMQKNRKLLKSQDKKVVEEVQKEQSLLEKVSKTLNEGKSVRSMQLSEDKKRKIQDLHLLTTRKILYLCNIDEESITGKNKYAEQVKGFASERDSEVLEIAGKVEAEIAQIEDEEEKNEFMEMLGIEKTGLNRLIKTSYRMLGLRTFFTENGREVRAWTFKKGTKAPEAAGIIHSDFQKGFIKAEVYPCEELFEAGSVSRLKEMGKFRIEGRDYVIKDGDVVKFRFNV